MMSAVKTYTNYTTSNKQNPTKKGAVPHWESLCGVTIPHSDFAGKNVRIIASLNVPGAFQTGDEGTYKATVFAISCRYGIPKTINVFAGGKTSSYAEPARRPITVNGITIVDTTNFKPGTDMGIYASWINQGHGNSVSQIDADFGVPFDHAGGVVKCATASLIVQMEVL